MKKFTALIALMLCVTIGGVYATWTYAGTDDIADAFAEAKVTITDVELTGANGTYKVESNLVLTIEPAVAFDENAETTHKAVLVFGANNNEDIYLRVTFTPATNAPEAIKENGVPSELYFTTTVPMEYKMDAQGNYDENGTPINIFTFSNVSDGYFDENIVWTKNTVDGKNIFTKTYYESDLKSMITLNNGDAGFVLDTKAEHDAFREALGGNIVVRVTDGIIDGNKLNPKEQGE